MIYLFSNASTCESISEYFYDSETDMVFMHSLYEKSVYVSCWLRANLKQTLPVPYHKPFPRTFEFIDRDKLAAKYNTDDTYNLINFRIEEIIYEKLTENH